VIPKSRQRGISTVIQLLMLDTALFTNNFKGLVIAQDEDAAQSIFRDKLKFAYQHLPPIFHKLFPLQSNSKTEILLPNGSSVGVTTSARSSTCNFLHISEFGKISAKYPDKAREIITGSIPAVPQDGLIFVESTAEGREGEFYKMVMQAKKLQDSYLSLSALDYKLHFYSWWDAPEYQIDPNTVIMTQEDHNYFDRIEREIARSITLPSRAWYCKTLEGFGGDKEKMWQEYPSTITEPFLISTEGTYYAQQLSDARKNNRITQVPHDPTLPVYTAWDIGANDETAIWCIQIEKSAYHVINYVESSGEPFAYFVNWLMGLGYTWAKHLLPHDAEHTRQQGLLNRSAREMLQELAPGWIFEIVPRIPEIFVGIQQTRDLFPKCRFDEVLCDVGLKRLELYKKEWDKLRSCWKNEPRHDASSNGADSFRQFAQTVFGSACRSMQLHSSMDFGILKKMWWKVWKVGVPMPVCSHVFMSVNTAFGSADNKEMGFNACTRWGIFWSEQEQRHQIITLGLWFSRCGYDELRDIVKAMVKDHNVDIVVLNKASGVSLIRDMRRAIPGKIRAYSSQRGEDPVNMAYSVSSILEAGQVHIPAKPWAIGDGKGALGLIDYAAVFPHGSPPSANICNSITQALIYLRAGHWSGDHPDDEDDYNKPTPPKTEEETEDTVEDTVRYYA
jgi:phage terminase large subunit-like protein